MNEGVVGAELIAANSDARHLLNTHAHKKILIGKRLTRGLGPGGEPHMGEQSARESEEEFKKALQGAHIVFIAAGMGGGTGTGAAPVVAQLAKQAGAMVIAFVTKPFKGEGKRRMEEADMGLARLRAVADTVVTISNDRLLEMAPKLPLNQAFLVLDELLMDSIKSIIELITKPGLVNLDYNDLKTIIEGGGVSVMGLGESDDPDGERVYDAVSAVLNCTLYTTTIPPASTTTTIAECELDFDCPDDGFYCNGDEFCDEGTCVSADNPCDAELICDETTDECRPVVPPVTLQLTPDIWYQSRWVPLIKFLRIEGSNSHFDKSDTEITFTPDSAVIMLPLVIDEATINCCGILMPRLWAPFDAIDVKVSTGEEEATATMEIQLLPFMPEREKNLLLEE